MAALERQGRGNPAANRAAFQALVDIAFQQLADFDAWACAQYLYSAAVLGAPFSPRRQEEWEQRTAQLLATAKPQSVSNILWAFGTFEGRVRPGSKLEAALRQTLPCAWDSHPQHVSNSLWGASKLGWQLNGAELEAALAAVQREAPEMTPQALANIIWAWADGGWLLSKDLFAALRPELPRLWAEGKPQEVASSLWGASELKWQLSTSELEAALAAVEWRAGKMTPQQLSMTIRAWAHAGWPGSDRLFAALRPELQQLWAKGEPQTVAISVWGCSELGWQLSAAELEAALAAVEERAARMTPQGLSMTIRAWAARGWPGSDRLFAALRPELPRVWADGDARAVANSAWGASELKWQLSAAELEAALAAVEERAGKMTLQGLSMTIRAWAHAGWQGSGRLFAALRPELRRLWREGDEQEVSVGLRNASRLGWQLGELAGDVNAALLRELPRMKVEGVTQVRQVFDNEEWRQRLSGEAEAALEAREAQLGVSK